jgi:predicted 2-oxoglutarate/Fe(II)-dependent dioxygenase YbiX
MAGEGGRAMSITEELAAILGHVDRPGDFYATGRAELLAPKIEVEGVGPIALPRLASQAKQLIKAASRAPYGRGAETRVDTRVRRTWQIEASRIDIGGKHWAKTLAGIVARAADGLGVTGPITAALYKLLIYDKGSFFVSHRDTEKAPGMFATLVLALPSQSEGGELVVRHKDREARLELTCDEPSEIAFAAFYADCVHEVLPVTAGCRATLVFNLLRKGAGAAPTPPEYEAEAAQVAALLSAWAAKINNRNGRPQDGDTDAVRNNRGPEKLVWPLEHAYTPAELAFGNLKGADAAVARLLVGAAPQAGCDLHLALLSVWESGSAHYNGSYRRSWHDEDASDDRDEFEVIEVLDGGKWLSEWRRLGNAETVPGKLPLEDDEVSPPDALDGMETDEEHFCEATGNEGASFERTYSRATLVIWPSQRKLAVINQGGPKLTLPYLEELLAQWQAAGPKRGPVFQQQAVELAGYGRAAERDRGSPRRGCASRVCRAAQRGTEGNICQEAKPAPSRGRDPCGMSPVVLTQLRKTSGVALGPRGRGSRAWSTSSQLPMASMPHGQARRKSRPRLAAALRARRDCGSNRQAPAAGERATRSDIGRSPQRLRRSP